MENKLIYFNNGATTLIKPEFIYDEFIKNAKTSANMGRGTSAHSLDASKQVYETRKIIAKLFHIDNPLRIGFTKNATEGLNIGIKGLLNKGDHVITTVSEHNSVLRPLYSIREEKGVELSIVKCNKDGEIDPKDIEKEIKSNTKLIVMSHASNVTGNIFDIKTIGEIAKKNNIIFFLDTAQSAGLLDIDVKQYNIDMLSFTGHKYLFSFQGIGGLYVREGIDIRPLLIGGNTYNSMDILPKLGMPELVEAGTQNISGIVTLKASVEYILKNKEKIDKKEKELISYFLEKISEVKYLKLLGTSNIKNKVALFSLVCEKYSINDLAEYLEEEYNISLRTGLHCAPLIHDYIASEKAGTLRVSMSYFNTVEEIDILINGLKKFS